MDRIEEVQAKQKILAKWANDIVREIRRQKIIPGTGIRINVTSDGTIVNAEPQKGGANVEVSSSPTLSSELLIGRVASEPNTDGSFQANLFNPDDWSKYGTGTVIRPDLTHFATLDVGTTLLVHKVAVRQHVGGNAL